MQLTLASYNIHGCIGRDGRLDCGRVLAVLGEVDADVIALQEVDSCPQGEEDFLDRLSAGVRHLIQGFNFARGLGHYGNVLLSRLPLTAVQRVDLSLVDREPRGALDATFDCSGTPLQVVATHLGLHPFERRFQIRRLLDEVDTAHDHPAVLFGDINEWFAWGRPLRWLHRQFGKPPAPRTFPSGFPVFSLDRVWVRPRACLLDIRAHRSPLARVASDHLPVVARVHLDVGG